MSLDSDTPPVPKVEEPFSKASTAHMSTGTSARPLCATKAAKKAILRSLDAVSSIDAFAKTIARKIRRGKRLTLHQIKYANRAIQAKSEGKPFVVEEQDRATRISAEDKKDLLGSWALDCCHTGHSTLRLLVTDDNISDSLQSTPRYLMRAYTLDGKNHTNGYSSETLFSPSAFWRNNRTSLSILDMPFDESRQMLGTHLYWADRVLDELLSWTNSLLFAIVHAVLRASHGQLGAHICFIDTSKATTAQGESTAFYFAPKLTNAVGMLDWKGQRLNADGTPKDYKGWHPKTELEKLHERKATHEYLTHGVVQYPEGHLRHVPLDELIEHGLF